MIFGTASASPLTTSLRGPGDHLFTNSVIAVDADTGEYKWHYQTGPADAWDYDATIPKIVTDLEIDGKKQRGVFEVGKRVPPSTCSMRTRASCSPPTRSRW